MEAFHKFVLFGITTSGIVGGLVGISREVSPGNSIDRVIERTFKGVIFSCFGIASFASLPVWIIPAAYELTHKKLGC